MTVNNILFRCSQLGKIMTEARAKSDVLSKTCISHLVEVYGFEKHGIENDIVSPFLEKGIFVEEDAITLLSINKKQFYKKNEERFKNDFIAGTPDIITKDCVIDIKSSWDFITFSKSNIDGVSDTYYWQLQGYMALLGLPRAELTYCLIDTPEHLIEAEKRKLSYKLGEGSEEKFKHLFENIDKRSRFSQIPNEEKTHIKYIERNEKDIERIYSRVLECREYLKNNFNL